MRLLPTKVNYTGLNVFLYSNNPDKSAEWYKALGFRLAQVHDMPGGLKVYSFDVSGRTITIGPTGPFEPEHTQAWLRAKPWGAGAVLMPQVKDVDALHARATEVGAEIVEAPTDQPWGARTVVLRDPDGYWLMFDQPVRPPTTKPARATAKAKAKSKTAAGARAKGKAAKKKR